MVYYAHNIGLNLSQAKKLANGHSVRLKHAQLKGPYKVHLTKAQLSKLAKFHVAQKGGALRLSAAQLRFNRMHGAGFFSNLLNKAKNVAQRGVDLVKSNPEILCAA